MGDKLHGEQRKVSGTKWGKGLLLLILAMMALLSCKDDRVDYPLRQLPSDLLKDPAQITAGHRLFISKCVFCHGKSSEGRSDRATFFKPPAPDFTEAHYRKTDPAYLYWRIEAGKTVEPYRSQGSVMPAWGVHLSDENIWQIVAYLQARAH